MSFPNLRSHRVETLVSPCDNPVAGSSPGGTANDRRAAGDVDASIARCDPAVPFGIAKDNAASGRWPTRPWVAEVQQAGCVSVTDELPSIALIGRHALCGIRLNGGHVPEFAYLAASFADRIEVWPIQPLAYSVWGDVSSASEIRVGNSRVRLTRPVCCSPIPFDASPDGTSVNQKPLRYRDRRPGNQMRTAPANVHLAIQWANRLSLRSFREGVTIVGDDHPSLLRVHGGGLNRCDHAVVRVGSRYWFIDLDRDRLSQESPVATEFAVGCAPIQRGRMTYRLAGPSEIEQRRELLSAQRTHSPAARQKCRDAVRDKPTQSAEPPPLDRPTEKPRLDEALIDRAFIDTSLLSEDVGERYAGEGGFARTMKTAEHLSAAITQRLIHKHKQRGRVFRYLQLSALGFLAMLCVLVLVVVIRDGIMPAVASI